MIIERQDANTQMVTRFEERAVEQIRYNAPAKSFQKVQQLSERNELLYRHVASPWVSALANPLSAQVLKWLHPMRFTKLVYSDKLSPWMMSVAAMAHAVRSSRAPVAAPNALVEWEQQANRVTSMCWMATAGSGMPGASSCSACCTGTSESLLGGTRRALAGAPWPPASIRSILE
jgi:hypothetical protein